MGITAPASLFLTNTTKCFVIILYGMIPSVSYSYQRFADGLRTDISLLTYRLDQPFVFQPADAVDVDIQNLGDAKFGLDAFVASRKR